MVMVDEASSLKEFLLDVSHTDYTIEECEYILETKMLDFWLV